MLTRIEDWLSRPRAPLGLFLFTFALCLPALRYGLQADDLVFPWNLERGAPPWAMFEIEAGPGSLMRERGFLAWWDSPHVQGRFFRPLASLWHSLDFALWPNAVWLMHLFNVLLYAGAVGIAARLYRRFAPAPAIAGLAGLLFALDDGHALSAGWIAGRNTLLALLFALLALEFHARARETPRFALAAASVLSVALALLSAEAGVWALSLLVSYAIAIEPGSLRARLRSIAPALAVGAIWAGIYVSLKCGMRGSSFYRDPTQPLSALVQGVLDLPVWFCELFGPGGFPYALIFPTLSVRLAAIPAALALFWLLWPALRSCRECRFFALSAALCLAPLMFTLPASRVLLAPGFGALGWVSCSIAEGRAAHNLAGRVRAGVLFALHAVMAGAFFVSGLGATQPVTYGSEVIARVAQPGRDVILLQTPVELLSWYALLALTMQARADQAPRSIHQLYAGKSELWAERIDARTLDIEATRGWGRTAIERVFCPPEDMPKPGSEVRLGAFRARVLESTEDGMPKRVRFLFSSALESPERQWLFWDKNRPVAFTLPRVGERLRLAPVTFFSGLRP